MTSRDDWENVYVALIKNWNPRNHQGLQLDISRDYFALQTQVLGNNSLSKIKRNEIDGLRKRALNDKLDIPRSELMSIASLDTIRHIIDQDTSLTIEKEGKERFAKDILRSSRKLFAMCVHSRLSMNCLKELHDKGIDDESLPLEENHCCHHDCKADFRILYENQGGFMAPEFFNPGEHQTLHRSAVLPIRYIAKEDTANITNENTDSGMRVVNAPIEIEKEVDKHGACCGHGAYSTVYRVRIHPDHHRLSMVDEHPLVLYPNSTNRKN